MSTDSTELTFVRCHSCRSLVPALSTRCRMCGATLEQEAAAPVKKDQQEAVSVKDNSSVKAATTDAFESDPNEADPLASFLDDSEDENFLADDLLDDFDDSDDDDDFDEEKAIQELDSLLEELNSEDDGDSIVLAAQGSSETKELEASDEYDDDDEIDVLEELLASDEEDDEDFDDDPLEAMAVEEIVEEVEEDIEDIEEIVEPEVVEVAKPVVKRTKTISAKKEIKKTGKKNLDDKVNKMKTKVPVKAATKSSAAKSGDSKVSQLRAGESSKQKAAFSQVKTKANLFGWLVSYNSTEGQSLELREGKFFVTGSSLKKTDLIIEDDSVSTPHALVTVSAELGLQVQDLLSEQGVFVKRQGESQYQSVDDIEVIENGDWIRFGQVEYLVAFLPE